MKFVIKLFPEITIKSPPVRKRFISQLRKNIRHILRALDAEVVVTGQWDFIELEASRNDVTLFAQMVERLGNIPGISSWHQVEEYPLVDLQDILDRALPVNRDRLAGKTFRVTCQRSGKHDFQSVDVERFVGGGLNVQTDALGVKLKNPDVVVRIEIKGERYFLMTRSGEGLGGYPLGTQEPVLSLISGGFDSTVSSFMTMKRGLRTHFCFFNLGGHAHELSVKEVAYYLWNRFGGSHNVCFVTVPFEGVVEEILNKIDNSQMGVVLKRMMLRAADRVAQSMHIEALVTGESVAQVSSQTLTNLSVIDSVVDRLVLRPLITTDKQEIVNQSIRIGTEEFVKNIPEYCAVISKKPTTRARPEKIAAEEARFDFTVLDHAVESHRKVLVRDIVADDSARLKVPVVEKAGPNDVVVDIRHPDEEDLAPLELPNCEVIKMPFFQLARRFGELEADRHYLLYCEQGVMSQLHAMHLRDMGYQNVGVLQTP